MLLPASFGPPSTDPVSETLVCPSSGVKPKCPLKSKCTKGPKGRWVSRSLEEEYLERVRAYCHTEAYTKALRKRAVWIEPLFGEAKEWHGLGRFRLRGLEKVNAEALMIASGQNVKRL